MTWYSNLPSDTRLTPAELEGKCCVVGIRGSQSVQWSCTGKACRKIEGGRRHNGQNNYFLLLCPLLMTLMATVVYVRVSCSCSDVCSTCGSCPGTDRLCPSQPIRLSFCPRTQRASVIYHQFSISRPTHEKRNVHLADIKSEEPVPIQTRTLETHLVTQICISLSLSNNALLGLFLSFFDYAHPSDTTPCSSAAHSHLHFTYYQFTYHYKWIYSLSLASMLITKSRRIQRAIKWTTEMWQKGRVP